MEGKKEQGINSGEPFAMLVPEEKEVRSRSSRQAACRGCHRGTREHSRQNTGIAFGESTRVLSSDSPALEGDNDNGPGHEERNETHGDGERKHGVEIVGLQGSNSVLVAHHEGYPTSDKTERSNDLRRWSRRQVRCRRSDVQGDVCERTRQRKAHEHGAPLRMYHRGQH